MTDETTEVLFYCIEEEEWTSKISESLHDMLKNKTLCDTTLVSEDKLNLVCHSSVLAASSPYLHNILKTAIKNYHRVNLQVNISYSILKQVVDFIYTGRAAIASFQAKALLDAAKQLDIESLGNACSRVIGESGFIEGEEVDDVSIAEEDVKVINIRGVIQEPVNASALDENYEEEEEAADSNNVELTNGEKQNQETDYIMYEWTPTETSADKAPNTKSVDPVTSNNTDEITQTNTKPGISVNKSHICGTCHRGFAQQSHLAQHERLHTGERPYVCKTCNKCFTISSNLNRHLKIHTGERPYVCKICQRAFNQSSHLKQHEQCHLGNKPFQCAECQRTFTKSSHLLRHQKIHSGTKPYQCKSCPRAYSDKIHLIEHIRTHTGERPHHCEYCDKRFTFKTSLIQHRRLHTGEKPYGCDTCKVRFSRKQDLREHQKGHSNLREFVCGVCSAAFIRKKHLDVHMNLHLVEDQKDSFYCDVCGKRFRRKLSLLHHRKKMHSMLTIEQENETVDQEMLSPANIKKELVFENSEDISEEVSHTKSMNSAAEILTNLAKGLARDHLKNLPSSGGRDVASVEPNKTLKEVNKTAGISSMVRLPVVPGTVHNKHGNLPVVYGALKKNHEQTDTSDLQISASVTHISEPNEVEVMHLDNSQSVTQMLQVIQDNQRVTLINEDGSVCEAIPDVTDEVNLQSQILQQVQIEPDEEQQFLVVEALLQRQSVDQSSENI